MNLHEVRYQLLTAAAAALAQAEKEKADRAVLMIHEFVTPRSDPAKRARNERDLIRFLERMGNDQAPTVAEGRLLGAVRVEPRARLPSPAALYIGKATRQPPSGG